MSAWVTVALDTTAPTLQASITEDNTGLATLALTTDDAAEVRIWGDIDVTWPGNADFGETEGEANWIEFEGTIEVRLAGAKRLQIRARDDVWNESAVVEVQVGVAPPVPVPEPPRVPGWPGAERPEEKKKVKTVVSTSTVRVRTRWYVHKPAPEEAIGPKRGGLVLASAHRTVALTSNGSLVFLRSGTQTRSSRTDEVGIALEETAIIHRRPEGPDTEAALLDLDLL